MLRDDAIALLADRLNRTDLTTRAINEMQMAQIQLESLEFLPWFLLTEMATAATIAFEERLALPSDFLREAEEDEATLWTVDNTTTPPTKSFLSKSTYALLVEKYKNSTYQKPLEYALVGQYFRLRPIPDVIYTVQFLYYAQAALLTTNIENLWLKYAPDLVIANTGMLMSRYPNDTVRYAMFAADYKIALDGLKKLDVARREANLERTMGDADA
jgi:hypothetical protein